MGRYFEASFKLSPNSFIMTLARIRWQNSELLTHFFNIYLLTFCVRNSFLFSFFIYVSTNVWIFVLFSGL